MNHGNRKGEDLSSHNDSPLKRALFSAHQGRLEPGDESPGDMTGIILAGGASRRMGGHNKAFLELDGRPLIEIVIGRVQSVCAEVLIVAGDTRSYTGLGVPLIEDRFRDVGVLGGLHAGLDAASHELALVVGCDMPFLNPGLLRAFAEWAKGYDVVVLRHTQSPPLCGGDTKGKGGYIEPLHAAYRRTCLPAIETAIHAEKRRIVSFFPNVRVHYITANEIVAIDPNLRSFRNVNTIEEWEMVQSEWQRQSSR